MKKKILTLVILLFSATCMANLPPLSEAVISEVYFDGNGDWTLELYFGFFNQMDEGYILYTLLDTASFVKFPDSSGFVILTKDDMSHPIYINPSGDKLYISDINDYYYVTNPFVFGNVSGSWVNPPYPGQSLINANINVNYDNFEVKDDSPGIGLLQDPPAGLFHGYVYDCEGNPVPFFHLEHATGFGIEETWTDSNGYFYNPTFLARNYNVILDNGYGTPWIDTNITVEPDSSVYAVFRLPIHAQVTLNGYCHMQDAENDSGILVILTPQCGSGIIQYACTGSDGYFETTIPAGRYYYRCSKEGFLPDFSPTHNAYFSDSSIPTATLQPGLVNEISMGAQNGIWESENPLWLFGDVYIPAGDTLRIFPGTVMVFKRFGSFNVYGTLLAEGEEENPVIFENTEWEALRFEGNGSSGSILEHLSIPENDSGIIIRDAAPLLSHCNVFDEPNNRNVVFHIRGNASPVIKATKFDATPGCPPIFFNISGSSTPVISNSVFNIPREYFGYPLAWVRDYANPLFCNNVFTIQGRAIYYTDYANPRSRNNIFFHTPTVFDEKNAFSGYTCDYSLFHHTPSLSYWSPLPGWGELCQVNGNGDSCDIYHNIFMDPMFVDTSTSNYHLQAGSPCIDAGDPNDPYDPDSTIVDMGAYYFDQLSIGIREKPFSNPGYTLEIIPNPTNGNANIVLHKEGHLSWNNARIRLFDLNGRTLAQEEIGYLLPGDNEYRMGLQELTNSSALKGTYLLSLEINNTVMVSKKLIVE